MFISGLKLSIYILESMGIQFLASLSVNSLAPKVAIFKSFNHLTPDKTANKQIISLNCTTNH